jgi:hypothetical protein
MNILGRMASTIVELKDSIVEDLSYWFGAEWYKFYCRIGDTLSQIQSEDERTLAKHDLENSLKNLRTSTMKFQVAILFGVISTLLTWWIGGREHIWACAVLLFLGPSMASSTLQSFGLYAERPYIGPHGPTYQYLLHEMNDKGKRREVFAHMVWVFALTAFIAGLMYGFLSNQE